MSAPDLSALLAAALDGRRELTERPDLDAYRLFAGAGDGLDGLYIDRYAQGAAMIVYEGSPADALKAPDAGATVLEALAPLGVRAVYHKPFPRDRSKLGGQMPDVVKDPTPIAGQPLEPAFPINEYGATFEVALYDGYSTGIFLDQRENRATLAGIVAANEDVSVLNTFAYTCAFSVVCANAGAQTTSVDVSGKYLKWGQRNFAHNDIDSATHRFTRMDTFEFFAFARKKALSYDVIILDPPSFAAGNKRKGISAWSSVREYPRLVKEASELLTGGGVIFASTNTRELCAPGALRKSVVEGLGKPPMWLALPDPPVDFAPEAERFAACMFTV